MFGVSQVGTIYTTGSKIAEHFMRKGTRGEWVDSTGKGYSTINSPILYLAQSSSPWANGIYARALLKAGNKLPALPGGWMAGRVGVKPTVLLGLTLMTISIVGLMPRAASRLAQSI